jgi:pyruvate/2-oxoglutarate dehydrogenase complex dihydrolipoamide dehydrogenase (E3) component
MTSTPYDVIVIGTSQGGRLLPIAFAKAGRKVALIERDHIGGVCVLEGKVSLSHRLLAMKWLCRLFYKVPTQYEGL